MGTVDVLVEFTKGWFCFILCRNRQKKRVLRYEHKQRQSRTSAKSITAANTGCPVYQCTASSIQRHLSGIEMIA